MAETDLTPEEVAADARLPLYNVGDYDPETNEYGFDNDGHTVNQMRQARDVGMIGRLAHRLAALVKANADRFEAAVRSIEEGPVTSVNGKVGPVMIAAGDVGAFPQAGGRFSGAVASEVIDHGVKGNVTEDFSYELGNTHKVAVNGTLTINPTGLVEGGIMQVNVLFQSGAIAVSGTTFWEQGSGRKTTVLSDLGISLTANTPYRLIFEMVGGVRTGVFQ